MKDSELKEAATAGHGAGQKDVEYEPFGDEWRAHMMELRKADLVEMLRTAWLSAQRARSGVKS